MIFAGVNILYHNYITSLDGFTSQLALLIQLKLCQ